VQWVIDAPRTGAQNMARDEALLSAARPAVRVYGWRPACVSLGYAQPDGVVRAEAALRLGVDVVRRPTGGGALLHEQDELTYAVVLPRSLVPADMAASYRLMAGGVRDALEALGVPAAFAEGHGGDQDLCYMREQGISITADGRKISGGAQKRTRDAVLQHGTLLVTRDATRLAALFGGTAEAVEARTTCIADYRDPPSWSTVAEAVLDAYRRRLGPLAEAAVA
jgi:lipoate-protein ligase A